MAVPGEESRAADRIYDEDAYVGIDTTRSGTTQAVGDDGISLGGASVETLDEFPSPPEPQALHKQKEIVDKLTKENAELRRHVKRRTQALDTIRRAYI
ncbi:unnamed protein product, partial [Ectocarpus sp. 8 AP-2014]